MSNVVHFADYRYGAMLASQGIGLSELSKDWPEVLRSEYAMRGYRETQRKLRMAMGRGSDPDTPLLKGVDLDATDPF